MHSLRRLWPRTKRRKEAGRVMPKEKLSPELEKAAKAMKEVAFTHLRTGSPDAYGLGLYNGMLMAISLITGHSPNYLSLNQYLHAQGRARETTQEPR